MKSKKKASSDKISPVLESGKWLIFDASGMYTGSTLWETRRMAKEELEFAKRNGKLPRDGVWRIRRVRVSFAQ